MLMIALLTTISMGAQNSNNRQSRQNKQKDLSTEKVYVSKSSKTSTFHKNKNCKKLKTKSTKTITLEKALDKDYEPCSTCYDSDTKKKFSNKKNSNKNNSNNRNYDDDRDDRGRNNDWNDNDRR